MGAYEIRSSSKTTFFCLTFDHRYCDRYKLESPRQVFDTFTVFVIRSSNTIYDVMN
jgi:hypothetical protein